MTVKTNHGEVEGFLDGRLWKFLGIPYGKAERFGAPRAYDWKGVWKADHFGKKSVQKQKPGDTNEGEPGRDEMGEDCLNLNIHVPAGENGELPRRLPVAVYIHGGAFQDGSNRERQAERVIGNHSFLYVSINYRLGVLGYLYLGEALGENYRHTGNNGTLDQLLALEWIYENIEFFGGDRSRITLFGESAGAKAIGALMLRPELKKWCGAAMLASGGYQCIRDAHTASVVAKAFYQEARKRGVLRKKEEILTMDADLLMEIQGHLVDNPGNTCMFGPVADGIVLPFDWQERIRRGEYWSGNAIVGSCLHEMVFLRMLHPDLAKKAPEIASCLFGENGRAALETFGKYEEDVRSRGKELSCGEAADEWVEIFSDFMYRTYSRRLAKLLTDTGSRVWYYSFEYGTASHVLDQSMAFDGAAGADAFFPGIPLECRERTAELIHESYARFLETGSPEWDGIAEWKPLCEKKSRMIWKETPEAADLDGETVLEGFPDSVYRLL